MARHGSLRVIRSAAREDPPVLTWTATLSGAALRTTRTAAGRRALQLVLLAGALVVLGFLCGGRAQAAEGSSTASVSLSSAGAVPSGPVDGVRSLTSSVVGTVGRLTHLPGAPAVHPGAPTAPPKPVVPVESKPNPAAPAAPSVPKPAAEPPAKTPEVPEPPANPVTDPVAPVDPVTRPVTDPVTGSPTTPASTVPVLGPPAGQLVQSVGGRVLQPVGDLVETVTAGLGEAAAQIPPLTSLPSMPALPGAPSLPGLPALPVHTLPVPVTQAPQPGAAGHAAEAAVDDRRSGAGAGGTAYGPRSRAAHVDTAAATHVRGVGQRMPGAGYAPAQQAPDADPTGELVSRSAVDNGSSRHSDAHAVPLNHRAPMLLVPGAAARADAAGIRDRHRDIPVFPG
jgi:hypothetical protein